MAVCSGSCGVGQVRARTNIVSGGAVIFFEEISKNPRYQGSCTGWVGTSDMYFPYQLSKMIVTCNPLSSWALHRCLFTFIGSHNGVPNQYISGIFKVLSMSTALFFATTWTLQVTGDFWLDCINLWITLLWFSAFLHLLAKYPFSPPQ